jgi:hypothetical protein
MAAGFERIAHEHCRHSEEAKERKSIHPVNAIITPLGGAPAW